MLAYYRSNQRKIAMGLLGFHQNLKDQQHLLHEIDTYETDNRFILYCYYCQGNRNVQGVIGIEVLSETEIMLHDISLNPSYRGENLGFQMLTELQALYPGCKISGTKITQPYLEKWLKSKEH